MLDIIGAKGDAMLYRSVRDDQKYTSRVLRFLRINNNTHAHDATNDEAAAVLLFIVCTVRLGV